MLEITEYILINLIRLIVLISMVDLRVFGDKNLSVRISFMVFSVELSDIGKRKKKRKIKNKLSKISFLLSFLNIQVPKTVITVRSFNPQSLPKTALGALASGILGATLLSYLNSKAMGYVLNENNSEGNIDLTFSFPLYTVFISLIQATYYYMKKRFKKRGKNVRI